MHFGGAPVPLQDPNKVLVVAVNRGLRFARHIRHIAQMTSRVVSALRRVASSLDRKGRILPRSGFTLGTLLSPWILNVLCRLTHQETEQYPASGLDNDCRMLLTPYVWLRVLSIQTSIAGYRVQVQGVSHLAGIRQPVRVTALSTRWCLVVVTLWKCRIF